jgi:hypothetical protein
MSNILKHIDLTDRAIRRAVFAVLDGPAAKHAPTAKDMTACRSVAFAGVVSWQFDSEQAQR